MAKKTNVTLADIISSIKDDIQIDSGQTKIPNIIDFCESNDFLGLANDSANPIHLYPLQKIILKAFYRGSLGNEDLQLTKEEIELCKEIGLDNDESGKGNILGKFQSEDKFKELVLVWGRRCVSKDTIMIDPADGSVSSIGNLWDSGRRNINSYTYNESTGKMEVIKDAEIIQQGERECYKLTLLSGHEIEVTDNHPFMTQRGWVQLKNLDPADDKIAVCESLPFFGESKAISEDEAALLGYMTADGNCSKSSTFLTCSNPEILCDFTERLNKISDNLQIFKDPWTKANSKDFQHKITSKRYVNETFWSEKENRYRTRRAKNGLMKLMEKWGLAGKTCHHKQVPIEMFKCPKNVVATYLRSLFSCDGNLGKRNGVTFEFATVNRHQAHLVQMLLSKFGICAFVRKKKIRSSIVNEKGVVKTYDTYCYIVYFSRKKYVECLLKEIGFVGKKDYVLPAIDRLSEIDSNIKTNHIDTRPFSFFHIRRIEKVGVKTTFDVCVSNKYFMQNFVAQGFVVHNSGKDFLVSIIALYEAMRLLECEGGDPYALYGIADSNPITILTIASSGEQAKIAFREIRNKIFRSPYFQDKFLKDGITTNQLFLLTPRDKEGNKELKVKGLPQKKGSIIIEVGHSASGTLVGKGCIAIIFDEVASYKTTGGGSSGDVLYGLLTPALTHFHRRMKVIGKDGNPMKDGDGNPIYTMNPSTDGKTLCISSPRGKDGLLFRLYESSFHTGNALMCKLPTWEANPRLTEQIVREDNPSMPEEQFMMEFGAQFSGTAGENFFREEDVKACFSSIFKFREFGEPGRVYFAHLDPATTSHNYALVILHKEWVMDKDNVPVFFIVIDHIKYWHPTPEKPVQIAEVDEYVSKLKQRFYIGLVTYDQWNNQESILKLRKAGLPNKMTRFVRQFKMKIYDELYKLVLEGRLKIPPHPLLKAEMLELQRKYADGGGYKVFPRKEGDGARSDDVVDCVAGACFAALDAQAHTLPKGQLIDMHNSGIDNSVVWRSMQGTPIGFGNGASVAKQLERHNSWPYYKR